MAALERDNLALMQQGRGTAELIARADEVKRWAVGRGLASDQALAAVDYTANDFTWSTANPEIDAIRSVLPRDWIEAFDDSLANHLNRLRRRCLRLFGRLTRQERPFQLAAGRGELMR